MPDETQMLIDLIKARIANATELCNTAVDEAVEGNVLLARALYRDCITLLHSIEDILTTYAKTTTTPIPLDANVLRWMYQMTGRPTPREEEEAEAQAIRELLEETERRRPPTPEQQARRIAEEEFKTESRTPPPTWTPEITPEETGEQEEETPLEEEIRRILEGEEETEETEEETE